QARREVRDLHEQSGFPNAGIAADENERTLDDSAAEHAAELLQLQGQSVKVGRVDLAEPNRAGRPARSRCSPDRTRGGAVGTNTLEKAVPFATVRTAAEPLWGAPATLLADEFGSNSGHYADRPSSLSLRLAAPVRGND